MATATEFYIHNIGPCTPLGGGSVKQIDSFEDLLKYTNSFSASMPYTIEINPTVYTYDPNKYINEARHTLGQTNSYKNHPIIKKEKMDMYKILVGDRLIYPADIIKFLTEQYGSALDFDVNAENKPVMLDNVRIQVLVGTYDPKTKKEKVVRYANWHYLDENVDEFLDRKTLTRMFGCEENLGMVPDKLIQMFKSNGQAR